MKFQNKGHLGKIVNFVKKIGSLGGYKVLTYFRYKDHTIAKKIKLKLRSLNNINQYLNYPVTILNFSQNATFIRSY